MRVTSMIASLLALVTFLFVPVVRAQAPLPVPTEFQDLYAQLDTKLTSFDAYIESEWDGQRHPMLFASDLSNANANQGTVLLQPNTLTGIRLTLDRLQQLGIQGVKISINYPILSPGIDDAGAYLAFYKAVADEVRSRDMKLLVSMGHMFPGIAAIPVDGYADTLAEYKDGRRELAHEIVREIRPDYLTVITEPTSEAYVTGLQELADPAVQSEVLAYILTGLEPGPTAIGAGVGTWEREEFVHEFVSFAQIDYIDLHIYPINTQTISPSFSRDFLEDASTYTDVAQAQGKRVVFGEFWLYKIRTEELVLGAFHTSIFGRDPYSFWQPLDQKYLALMAKLAQFKQVEFISPFWMQYFFAYINYSDTRLLTPGERLSLAAQNAALQIVAGEFSQTGVSYGELIDEYGDLCAVAADVNCDGMVGIIDLSIMLSNFGRSPAVRSDGDADENGIVGMSDISLLLASFGL